MRHVSRRGPLALLFSIYRFICVQKLLTQGVHIALDRWFVPTYCEIGEALPDVSTLTCMLLFIPGTKNTRNMVSGSHCQICLRFGGVLPMPVDICTTVSRRSLSSPIRSRTSKSVCRVEYQLVRTVSDYVTVLLVAQQNINMRILLVTTPCRVKIRHSC